MTTKIKCIFYVLFAVNIGLVLYYFNARDTFHTDELYSYAHANSTVGAFLSIIMTFRINGLTGDYFIII